MREVKRSALVAQPPARLFALISDVERYPEFVPGCTHARVEARSAAEVVATIGVRRGALRAEFTTRNELEPDRRVTMHLVRGPFRVLTGEWLLTPIGQNGSRVELTMRFEFSNPVAAVVFEPLFAETVGALVDAFVARARSALHDAHEALRGRLCDDRQAVSVDCAIGAGARASRMRSLRRAACTRARCALGQRAGRDFRRAVRPQLTCRGRRSDRDLSAPAAAIRANCGASAYGSARRARQAPLGAGAAPAGGAARFRGGFAAFFLDPRHFIRCEENRQPALHGRMHAAFLQIVQIVPAVGVKGVRHHRRAEEVAHLCAGHADLELVHRAWLEEIALLDRQTVDAAG